MSYRNPYEVDEIIWHVEQKCRNWDDEDNPCDYELNEEWDCWYEYGEIHTHWKCPKCGRGNDYSTGYDPDFKEYERDADPRWLDD